MFARKVLKTKYELIGNLLDILDLKKIFNSLINGNKFIDFAHHNQLRETSLNMQTCNVAYALWIQCYMTCTAILLS